MTHAQMMIEELQQESATTRRFLEQIPADKLTWKPHDKSMAAGQLAMHVATIPGMIASMVLEDRVPAPDFSVGFPQPDELDAVLRAHDDAVTTATDALAQFDDAKMSTMWRMMAGDIELFAMPRAAFLRSVLFNHLYHHRGQLGVYLRLLGATVPSAYGPSGDETPPDFEKMMEVIAAHA
ncbi:MAG: DinB family protein [Planctomycetota bacterium]